jgi:hypothetical protein
MVAIHDSPDLKLLGNFLVKRGSSDPFISQ